MTKIWLLFTCICLTAIPAISKDKESDYRVVVKDMGGNYAFDSVITADGLSKELMFQRAKDWIISNFKTEDNNIKYDAGGMSIATTGTIVLKTGSGFNWSITHCLCNFKLNIQFKDGRYRILLDNIIVQAAYADGIVETLNYDQVQKNNAPAKHIRREVNVKLASIADQLAQAVKGGNTKKDDW